MLDRKPREFLLSEAPETSIGWLIACLNADTMPEQSSDAIHVIEISAFSAAMEENKKLRHALSVASIQLKASK